MDRMRKLLMMLWWLPLAGLAQTPNILSEEYSFLGKDIEIEKLRQRNDTLEVLSCYHFHPCDSRLKKHFKILSVKSDTAYVVLHLERLDSIPLTTNPIPDDRFSVLVLKDIGSKGLGYLHMAYGLTKTQLDTVDTRKALLDKKFYFTYYSDAYLKELSVLKTVKTKEDVNLILDSFKDEKYQKLIKHYIASQPLDMYGSMITAEILTRACIAKGYDPVGAGFTINNLPK